jgi:hypothetical protein
MITQADSFCIYENKKSVENTLVPNTLSKKWNIYYKALRTTIAPVGCRLPCSGSTEIPSASNEPIGVSELTTKTPCPFASTLRRPALTGVSP